jgi:raffinose/stachyose/melibiose transport system permease protein
MKRSKIGYWIFLLPFIITYTLAVAVPAVAGVYYSFTSWDGIGTRPAFIGWQNYRRILDGGSDFWHIFLYTFMVAICCIVLVNTIGFLLGLLVTQKFRGTHLLRAVFFMPNLIGGILVGFIWQFIFTQVFNSLGKILNINWLQNWLSNASTGTIGMLIIVVWQMSGYMMLIYVAQLQNIPEELLNAASIDGAGRFQRLAKITMPLMMPAFTVGTFLTLSSVFKLFDQNLALTAGGPARSTEMLALNIYKTAFSDLRLGLAQAKAVIFLLSVATIGLIQLRISKGREIEM